MARGILGFARRRWWLVRFSTTHGKQLARHGRGRGASTKVLALSFILPVVSGLLPRIPITVKLREGTFVITDASELLVLFEVFADHCYPRGALPTRASVIVDAGANIGATLCLFRTLYPQARIIGLEPDPVTFDVCRRNVAGDEAISLRNEAVAGRVGPLTLRRPRGESWATSSVGDGGEFVARATTLDALIDEVGTLDLLKLDIEGAEWDVLRASQRLTDIRWIIGEFHAEAGVSRAEFFGLFGDNFDVMLDTIGPSLKGTFAVRRMD